MPVREIIVLPKAAVCPDKQLLLHRKAEQITLLLIHIRWKQTASDHLPAQGEHLVGNIEEHPAVQTAPPMEKALGKGDRRFVYRSVKGVIGLPIGP